MTALALTLARSAALISQLKTLLTDLLLEKNNIRAKKTS
jgi:hypothetical protein